MAPQILYVYLQQEISGRDFFLKPERVNKDWELPISMGSNGQWKKDTCLFLKWMPIFPIIPKTWNDLYEACKIQGADLAIGSRYVKGGGIVNWPRERIILSKGASIYTRLITWMPVKDPTAGFVCYKQEVLETINLDEIHFAGYAFQIEMKFAAWKLGFKIKEVPIIFRRPQTGCFQNE